MFDQIEPQIWPNIQIDIIVENVENYFIKVKLLILKRKKRKINKNSYFI